jgi:hypothetical protein
MRVRATASALFAVFVVAAVIAGLGLAALEGAAELHPILGILVTGSFFLMIPILIAAAVSAWRETRQPTSQRPESTPRQPFITPTTMFVFGAFAFVVSLALGQIAHSRPLSFTGALVAVLEAAAIPSLVASFVWLLVIWVKQWGR